MTNAVKTEKRSGRDFEVFQCEAKLVAISGSLAGETFSCDQDSISIGRDSSNDIQLQDSAVSRRHCVIRRKAGQYLVTDLDSRNGTLVNGKLIARATLLTEGSVLEIGHYKFLFKLDETPNLMSSTSSGEHRRESQSLL